MPNPVVHFEIGGRDSEKTQQFFTELFGCGRRRWPGLPMTAFRATSALSVTRPVEIMAAVRSSR